MKTETAGPVIDVPRFDVGAEPLDLLIVIVCYHVTDMTIDCLESLVPELHEIPGARVTVCENGTGDDSAERIAAAIERFGVGDRVNLVTLDENRGFTGGNNVVLEQMLERPTPYRYVLLLNADTLVHAGCLRYCHDLMEREDRIGALSCNAITPDGTPDGTGRKFPTPLRTVICASGLPWKLPRLFGWADTNDPGWDRNVTKRDVDWLCGAFLWIRGDVMARIGLLDEDLVFYGDDVEYCHRIRRAGYRCHYDPAVSITHFGGGSDDPIHWSDEVRSRYDWRSRYLVLRKCYGVLATSLVRVVDLSMWGLRLAYHSLTGRRHPEKYQQAARTFALLRRIGPSLRITGDEAREST